MEQPYLTASSPEYNTWVSASAGSGKTKILVDRFLRLLLQKVDPSKILCLTFTNSAAAEMVQRITQELSMWAICDAAELDEKLKALTGAPPSQDSIDYARRLFLECLDKQNHLQIQTIHSFCQSIVKQFPFETGMGLHAEIIDEYQKAILLTKTKNDFLNQYEKTSQESETINFLLENIHESSLDKLINNAITLNNFSVDIVSSQEAKDNYIKKVEQILSYDQNYSEKLQNLRYEFIKILSSNKNLIRDACDEFKEIEILKALNDFSALDDRMQHRDLSKLNHLFLTKDGNKRLKLVVKAVSEKYIQVAEVLALLQHAMFQYSEFEKSIKIAQFTKGFINLAYLINELFANNKVLRNQLDYNDLIDLSLKLINNRELSEWIKYQLHSQISYVMVDESQDTNLKQWQIIYSCIEDFFSSAIDGYEKKTMFVVGDPKQAIYSFQGSSPEIFLGMHQYISNFAEGFGVKIGNIKLTKSFRSDQLILKFIDKVFRNINQQNPNYFIEQNLTHISEISSPEASIEVWPLVENNDEASMNDQKAWAAKMDYAALRNPAKILADLITDRIHKLLEFNLANPSDIMILVRKRDELVDHLVASLKERNIPVNGADRVNLNQQLVIQDLVAVAKFILLPEDDYNLACLCKSPILNFTEDELFTLSQREEVSLWNNLGKLRGSKFSSSYSFLKNLLETQELHSPHNLFSYLLDIAKFRTQILARFGVQSNDVLDEFINLALEFEKTSYSLFEFVHFFENTNLEIKVNLDLKKEEVRIMTVHAAKGLESKIVILPDTTSIPQNKNNILLDMDNNLVLYSGNAENNNELYKNSLANIKLKVMQEYYRLLYVALTRAAQKLIICGWSSNENIPQESWYSILQNAYENFSLETTII